MITYITSASSISFISPPRYTEEKNPTPVDLAELAAMVDYSIEYDNSRSVILHLSTVLSNVDSNTEVWRGSQTIGFTSRYVNTSSED
ncbi:hypothetical protein SAY87_013086 [Trapa incisa]|uniref:Uncharacterized protein n=1 Tax=Trapa incisa TaxID=236973 RepID=A0AAN7K849_9MYRT|nr:hypothetical protein SAY87_013086 [Trapa incisa]